VTAPPSLAPLTAAPSTARPIEKVLVANRGEIAVRIVRACRDMGLPVVVAYSTADRDSLATRLADEAVCVGPGAAGRSYLNIPALVYAAARTGADAVHPGYGFLAEDTYFAQVCADAGLTFIGPSAEVIARMGDKIAARAAAAAADVPVLPGSPRPVSDLTDALGWAARIGYPVVLKAAAGGGGRGLRVVRSAADLPGALADLRRAARTLFFDDRVYVERLASAARHVEVQILADAHGRVLHLGDRDCSIQRRHQKLVEESPSTALDPARREEVCAAAVRFAASIGYVSAGTVEFLLDADGQFRFLEMNPRIQVEHPVTELRSGVDLVQWMIRIAAGEPLDFGQADVALRGHVLECRINAEDPGRDWQGSFGRLEAFTPPGGCGVRVDTHAYPGYRLPPYYDSLLAKVIVSGESRDEALRRMERALAELECRGVRTTREFHLELMRHPTFRAGRHTQDFLDRYLRPDGSLRAGPADAATPDAATPDAGTTSPAA